MQVFEIIERFKFSIIGVMILYVSVFVWSNWFIVKTNVPQEFQDEIVAVLDFSIDPVEDDNKTENVESTSSDNNANLMNVTANVTQEKTTYTNSFSKSQAEKEVWDELKAMEAAEFEALKGDNPEAITKSDKEDNNNPNLVKEGVDKNDKAGYGMDVQAIVSYYVKDRNVLIDKKPSYLCKSEGIVRVNIKVNQKGQVVSKTIDESNTNTQNECLRNAALEYAGLWKFNQNFKDELRKQGWIEFKYQAQ
jgi:hypothetical protein